MGPGSLKNLISLSPKALGPEAKASGSHTQPPGSGVRGQGARTGLLRKAGDGQVLGRQSFRQLVDKG